MSSFFVFSANYDGSLEKITEENRNEVRPIDPNKYFIAQAFKHMYTYTNAKPKYDHQAEIAKYKAKMDKWLDSWKNPAPVSAENGHSNGESGTPTNQASDGNDSTDSSLRSGFSPLRQSPTLSLNATRPDANCDTLLRDPLDSILMEDEEPESTQNVSRRYAIKLKCSLKMLHFLDKNEFSC